MRWESVIQDNQKNFSRLQMLIDAIVIAVTYVLAWMIRFIGPFAYSAVRALAFEEYMFALIFIIPGYLLLYQAFTLYEPLHMQGRRLVLANIIKANVLGLLLIVFSLYMMGESDFSRLTVYIFCVINIFAEWGVRLFIFSMLRKMRKRGLNQKQMILVGYSRAAEEYIDRIQQNPQWGYVVRGILDDNVPAGTAYNGIKVIGRIANLSVILPANRLDEIAITLGLSEYYRLEEIVGMCEKSGVHTKFIPDYNKIIPTKPYTEDILGLPVINIRYVPLSNTFNAMVKRLMDVVGAIMAIIVSSPVMLLMCILIKLTSPGPLIYRQERVGLHNKNFWMYKFRSMIVSHSGSSVSVKGESRITPLGAKLRKYKLDELPELWNVLIGDMSFVGPRPDIPGYADKLKGDDSRMLLLKPGITGLASLKYRNEEELLAQQEDPQKYNDEVLFPDKVRINIEYLDHWSFWNDIKIIIYTIFGKDL